MGLFKWKIELGEDLVQTIAYGYAKAASGIDVIRELKDKYKNEYKDLTFVEYKIEKDVVFSKDDLEIINNCEWEQLDGVKLYTIWED